MIEPSGAAIERLVVDANRQAQAIRYSRDRLRLRALGLGISAIGLVVIGPLGIAPRLRDAVGSITGVWQLQILLFFGILGVAVALVEAPLTFVSGFRLPHRYGLSNQSLREWVIDMAKATAIGTVLFMLSVELVYGLLRSTPDLWWLWSGLIFAAFTVVLSALAPVLILPLFFRLTPLRDANLAVAIRRLADRAGTLVAAVCEIDLSSKTPAANAAVIGLGRTRKIVLGDTLIEHFPPAEVEVVVAHELGHHVNGDLPRGIVFDGLLSLVGFGLANLALHAASPYWHFAGVWDLGEVPVLAVSLSLWGMISGALSNWYSRRREAAADAYSLQLTRLGLAFVNSEIRLTNQNLSRLRPPRWLELYAYTHPAPWRRIAMGERFMERQAAE